MGIISIITSRHHGIRNMMMWKRGALWNMIGREHFCAKVIAKPGHCIREDLVVGHLVCFLVRPVKNDRKLALEVWTLPASRRSIRIYLKGRLPYISTHLLSEGRSCHLVRLWWLCCCKEGLVGAQTCIVIVDACVGPGAFVAWGENIAQDALEISSHFYFYIVFGWILLFIREGSLW